MKLLKAVNEKRNEMSTVEGPLLCFVTYNAEVRVTNAKNTKNFRQIENVIINAKFSFFLEMNVTSLLLARRTQAPMMS